MTGDSDAKSGVREAQLAWLDEVLRRTRLAPSTLAEKSGFANNTLTRFRSPESTGTLAALTIEKIKRHTGLAGPGELQPEAEPSAPGDGRPFDHNAIPNDTPALAAMVNAALAGRPNATAWVLETDSLSSAGFHWGDILIVDAAVPPHAGDIVAAELKPTPEAKEIIFRVIEPPYLVGISNDPTTRTPLPINNKHVIVVGPVTECIRATSRR